MAENMRQKVKIEPSETAETEQKKARTEPSGPPEYSMKLLIDKNGKRVLFAEAGKDCVDFILFILSLPVSTLVRLLGKQCLTGSVANLYESVEKLDGSFLVQNESKDTLLKLPITPKYLGYEDQKQKHQPRKKSCIGVKDGYGSFQGRVNCGTYVSDSPHAICPSCRNLMSTKTNNTYVTPPAAEGGGFVKEEVKFIVMDDLVVKPVTSAMSSINLITQLGVKNISELEEKNVVLGIDEGVKLLKDSLVSKNALTSVLFDASGKN